MTRQRYSKKESINRIVRILEDKAPSSDQPDTLTGEILSEDEAWSDFAELLAGSLPNENLAINIVPKYGHMFAHNATGTVIVASADVYYAVSGSIHSGPVGKFTFANGMHLVPTYAGRYLITYSMGIQSASANQEIETAIMINGIGQTGSSTHSQTANANIPRSLAGNMIVDVTAGSRIGLAVLNHTGGNNVMVVHANMSVFLVAPYGG